MAKIPEYMLKKISDMYYRDGLSMLQVANKLGVSIDAVTYFMRRHGLYRRTFSEINHCRFENKKPSFKIKTNLTAKEKELKAIGVMLYWGEGFQSDTAHSVDFANSKPEMVRIFLRFLREICGVKEEKLRAYLYAYSNQNVPEIINYWSNITKIPQNRFSRPFIRKDFDMAKKNKMRYGLLHIRYYDKKLLLLIREWIGKYVEKY